MGSGIGRLALDSTIEQKLSLLVLTAISFVDQGQSPNHKAPSSNALGGLHRDPEALLRIKVRLDSGDDAFGDLVLNGEDVIEVPVVPLGPDVIARLGVNY